MGSVYHSLLKHLWALSSSGLLWIKLLWALFVQVCICVSMFSFFLFLRYIFKSAIAGLCNNYIFNFIRSCHPFSRVAVPRDIPTSNVWVDPVFLQPYEHSAVSLFFFFNFSHLDRCIVMSPYGLIWISLMTNFSKTSWLHSHMHVPVLSHVSRVWFLWPHWL